VLHCEAVISPCSLFLLNRQSSDENNEYKKGKGIYINRGHRRIDPFGIMGVVFATTIVTAVDGFLFTRDSAIKSQKAQLALARIERELLDMTSIDSAPTSPFNSVTYTRRDGTSDVQFQITKNGNQITLKKGSEAAQPLIDDVSTNYGSEVFLSFKQQNSTTDWVYANGLSTLCQIKVILKLNGYAGVQTLNFETTVNPRNNTLLNAPKLY
jgi:hypothetical protein